MRYKSVLLAGTFDGLHAGHQAVINTAFRVSEKVTIGVTSDGFVARFKSQIPISNVQKTIHSYRERKRNVELWFREQGYFERATIVPINDPYEPAASMKDLDALIVTSENKKRGEHINALRQGATLPQLTLIEVPMVAAEDGKPVSSTRMRNGEIDGDGRLIMPESMRTILGKPLGTVLEGAAITASIARSFGHTIITVGDIATKTLLDAGIIPKLAIIDGMVGRKPYPTTVSQLRKTLSCEAARECLWKIQSGPGFISKKAVKVIQDCFTHPSSLIPHHTIIIDGEEDLLVLPAILHAPLGSILYYGQPTKGLVEVVVTAEKKQEALALLGKFT